MKTTGSLGEFEQLVLLAILQQGEAAYALAIRRTLEEGTDRAISRGALYRTLDRLGAKNMVEWVPEEPSAERGGHPRRRFTVTHVGLTALRRSRAVVDRLSAGLERLLRAGP